MHQIVVVAEPNDSRPIYLWRLLGLQLPAAGANAVRTYTVRPTWLLDLAESRAARHGRKEPAS